MRCSIAGEATVVGTSARPIASLYATSTKSFRLREVGVCNTTATEVAVALVRLTNTTGQGAGLTEAEWDDDGVTPVITGFAGHTADGGIGDKLREWVLGAAKGSGVIWTFGDSGIEVAAGTSNGVGIIVPTGTGQICKYYFDWDE
jgi:hypothetical protein